MSNHMCNPLPHLVTLYLTPLTTWALLTNPPIFWEHHPILIYYIEIEIT